MPMPNGKNADSQLELNGCAPHQATTTEPTLGARTQRSQELTSLQLPKNTLIDSYDHMLPAESNLADIGPFQHYDLGGNLSEWIASPNPATPTFIGGNFRDQYPVSNVRSTRTAPTPDSYPFIGFRTAR